MKKFLKRAIGFVFVMVLALGFSPLGVVQAQTTTSPLIHVLVTPNYSNLPAGSSTVLYYYSVTNVGVVSLSNVYVTDNKCVGAPTRIAGDPGDLNNNNLLDSNEVWNFICAINLNQTTTNTVTAYGTANGLISTDSSSVTVYVGNTTAVPTTPTLPATGFGPANSNTPNIIISTLGLVAVLALFLTLSKTKSLI